MSDTAQFDVVHDGPPKRGVLDTCVLGLSALTLVTAVGLSLRQPEQLMAWLVAGLFLPCVLLVTRQVPALAQCPAELRRSLAQSFLGVGLLILVPLSLRLLESFGMFQTSGVQRTTGVLLGGALVVAGAYLPNRVLPAIHKRFAGLAPTLARTLGFGVLAAGLAFAVIWLAAPISEASLWAGIAVSAVLIVAGLRCALCVWQAR